MYLKRIFSSKIYDKRDDFYFDIINLPFFSGYFWDGPEPFFEKTVEDRLNLI